MPRKTKLEGLVSIEPVRFFEQNSFEVTDSIFNQDSDETRKEIKLFDEDDFNSVVLDVLRTSGNTKDPFILGHIGGSDALLSLYSSIAHSAKGNPQLFIVDRKQANIENMFFRLALAYANKDRVASLIDMFGLTQSKESKVFAEDFLKGNKNGLTGVLNNQYNASMHANQIVDRIYSAGKVDEKVLDFFSKSVKDITRYIHAHGLYEQFVRGVFDSILRHDGVHYLTRDYLFEELRDVIVKKPFSLHAIKQDMSDINGFEVVKGLLTKYLSKKEGVRPISVAVLQHADKSDAELPYLAEMADQIVYRIKRGSNKFLVSQDSSNLTFTANTVQGLQKYKEDYKERKPIEGLERISPAEGLEWTMPFPHLQIGNSHANEVFRDDLIDIINGRGVTFAVTSNALFGPCVYRKKQLRKQKDPEYMTFDSQLKKFKAIREQTPNTNWVYVPGQDDFDIIDDLKVLYTKQLREEKTGKSELAGFGIGHREEAFMSEHEDAERLIRNYIYPYFLRLGHDPTGFATEVGRDTDLKVKSEVTLVELVNAFKRYDQGSRLSQRDLEIVNWDLVKNDTSFSYFPDYSGMKHRQTGDTANFNSERERNFRAIGNTKYSGKQEYKNPEDMIEQIAAWAKSGVLSDEIPESIIFDTQQVSSLFKISYNKFIGMLSSLADDRRKYDPDFAAGAKNEVSSRTQRRTTQHKRINVPSASIISGDPSKRMIIEMYNPNVADKVRKRQKHGSLPDVWAIICHDTQIGSLTERLALQTKALDYGTFVCGAEHFIGVGDRGQFRNYKEMPNENAWLGGITIQNMQQAIVELSRPYFRLPQFKSWVETIGNHEWNTDVIKQGHHLLEPLRQAIQEHVETSGHNMVYNFPAAGLIMLKNGDLVKSEYGTISINGFNIVYGHMFGMDGMGKDGRNTPTKSAMEYITRLGDLFPEADMTFNGHWHHWEMLNELNRCHFMFSTTAGESGFELARKYYSEPRVGYLRLGGDGTMTIETLSENEIMNHQIQHPEIIKRFGKGDSGLDKFIENAVTIPVQKCYFGEGSEMKPMYRRNISFVDSPRFD
ncbi:MAG: hypothetical protein ACMXYG_00595 [Candidatus Woesearchaeota archaeon]